MPAALQQGIPSFEQAANSSFVRRTVLHLVAQPCDEACDSHRHRHELFSISKTPQQESLAAREDENCEAQAHNEDTRRLL